METRLPPQAPPQARVVDPWHRARASPPPILDDAEAGYAQERPSDYLSAVAMQPPRLQGGSCCSKIVVTAICCSLMLIVLVACNAVLSQPLVVQARASVKGRLAPASRSVSDGAKKPMPALLHRFGALKRVPGGQKGGVDALHSAFPRWRSPEGSIKLEDAVVDLAFGIAAVVEQLDPALELKVVAGFLSPPPPPAPELVVDNGESDEELEL